MVPGLTGVWHWVPLQEGPSQCCSRLVVPSWVICCGLSLLVCTVYFHYVCVMKFMNCIMYVRIFVCIWMRHSYVIFLWFAYENYILKPVYMNCSEYWDLMYSRSISKSYMICARVCIMYYILCIDLLYILIVFYLIMYDYVYTVRVCLIVYLYFVWSESRSSCRLFIEVWSSHFINCAQSYD